MTISLFAQSTVKDFDAWKKVADTGKQLLKDHGVIANSIHRSLDNPNSIMIYHQFADQAALNAFLALVEASQDVFIEAGVLTTEMWYGEDVSKPI